MRMKPDTQTPTVRKKSLATLVRELVNKHVHMKANGRGATSYRTREERTDKILLAFKTLRILGMGIEDPANLTPRHVERLVKYWIGKGNKPRTIQNDLSHLRILAGWINKPGMVKSLDHYLPPGMAVPYAAQTDKSWSGNDIDFFEIWDEMYRTDKYVAMQLLMMKAFGLRCREARMLRPWIADHETHLDIGVGAKGKRPRSIPIQTEFQRQALNAAKEFVLMRKLGPKAHLGDPDRTLKGNEDRYKNVMKALGLTKADKGVTGHGLRVDYTIAQLEMHRVIATIKGGSGKVEEQDCNGLDSKFATDVAYLRVSENLGHSRKNVITAYSGPLKPNPKSESDKEGEE